MAQSKVDELKALMAVIGSLVSAEGHASQVTGEKEKARFESLKDQPLQQKLFTNIVAAHRTATSKGAKIKFLGDDIAMKKAPVEDLFMGSACEIVSKVVNCLVTLQSQGQKKRKKPIKAGQAPELPPDTLGARDLASMRSLLQFIVAIGIHPYLELQLRPDAAKYCSEAAQRSQLEKKRRVMTVVKCLRDLHKHPELIPLLRSDTIHCAVLCALIEQVVYEPSNEDKEKSGESFKKLQDQARSLLNELVQSSLGPPLISQLFYLQHVAQRSMPGTEGD